MTDLRLSHVLVALFALTWSAAAQAPPYVHAATGISLPRSITGGFYGGIPEPYKGIAGDEAVSFAYHSADITVTVYIRKIEPTQDTSATAVVLDSLAAIAELEKRGVYSDVKISKRPDDTDPPGWAMASLTAKDESGVLQSHVLAHLREGHVIKLRVTTNVLKSKEPQAFIAEFLKLVGTEKP